jgi:FkbM family methyltransferase
MKLKFLYRGLKAQFRDQRGEIRSLVSALAKDEVAVDVGANKGAYIPALSRAVSNGRVVAFEPQPVLADYLRRACAAARFENVTVEAAGVSSAAGAMTLYIPGAEESSPGATLESVIENRESCRHIQVPVVTLDAYFAGERRHIGGLKIDVEGHELAVLQGAVELIRAHSPRIVVECENRHLRAGSVYDVLDFLRSLGYEGHFVHRHALRPLSEFRVDIHQPNLGDRFWDAPDYCNNFVLSRGR